jgi:glutaredoxin
LNIEIWGKDQCPQCDAAIHKAQAMVQESNDTYIIFKLGKDFAREDILENFPGARTFPQIRIDGKNIGGWSEFQKL